MMTTMSGTAGKKPFWKKLWFWIVVGVLVILGVVANLISGGGRTTPGAAPSATASTPADSVTVPDLTGKSGSDARKELTALGLSTNFDGGEDTVIAASNWVVDAQEPAIGSSVTRGDTITLKVSKPQEETTATAPANPLEQEAPRLCDEYAIEQFPYGYNPHRLSGTLANRMDGDRHFWKYTATVKDASKQKTEMNIECYVGDVNGEPTVVEWNAY